MVVRLLDVEPRQIALLCRLVECDLPRIDLNIAEIDMMIDLEDRGMVAETLDQQSFTLTPIGRELAVKASVVMNDLPESSTGHP